MTNRDRDHILWMLTCLGTNGPLTYEHMWNIGSIERKVEEVASYEARNLQNHINMMMEKVKKNLAS